ncbi:MAG: hypothetical protein R2851_05480 [Caldilineaceae bacterium]
MTNLAQNPAYNDIKHDLVRRMWRFAAAQQDELIMNPYYTVDLHPGDRPTPWVRGQGNLSSTQGMERRRSIRRP